MALYQFHLHGDYITSVLNVFLHYRHIEYKKDITCFSKDCFDMCIKSSNKAIQWLCVSICVYAFFWGWWDIMQNLMTSEWKTWK